MSLWGLCRKVCKLFGSCQVVQSRCAAWAACLRVGNTCAPCGARLALAEGKWPSLSSLDRRICSLFFYWSTWNVFLGAMLGGSAFSQLGIIINNPAAITRIIGTALPASSNFFINYVIIQVALGIACMVPPPSLWPQLAIIKAFPMDTERPPHAVAEGRVHSRPHVQS